MLGMLTFLDPPRPDTKTTIEQALENGVDVKMITGDQVRPHTAAVGSGWLGLIESCRDESWRRRGGMVREAGCTAHPHLPPPPVCACRRC